MSFIKHIEERKGKVAFFMLPLLVSLLFSCPVKRALNPSFSDSALALQNENQFSKKATSFTFVNTASCSSAGKIIEKSIILSQQQNPLPLLSLPPSDFFETPFATDSEKLFNVNGLSYLSFSIPLFLKNRSLLI